MDSGSTPAGRRGAEMPVADAEKDVTAEIPR